MDALCAAIVGAIAGWFAPTVVAVWTGAPTLTLRTSSAVASAVVVACATTVPHGEAFAVVGYWCVCLVLVDTACRRLPDGLTLTGAAAVAGAAAWDGSAVAAAVGGVVLAGTYAAVHVVTRGGVGAGDVKLALSLGALTATCGGVVWASAAMIAPVITAALSGFARGDDGVVPHGPSMCAATLVAWVSVGT